MKQGKLRLGNEAIPVEYEPVTQLLENKRQITGTLVPMQTPIGELSTAITKMTAAMLISDDGDVLSIEFKRNDNCC